ncbi:hypothetical protein SAMN04489835_4558 [Mycolicibacterium rutilum]|uniref:PPE family protein n=1 Tax=Mycolicibacterium rutilum TaxID=370526 RepID=A0A1H6L2G2_MYCRU|nr:hypothetical protein [Mycolicibacterium rutilum]SEH82325.1 hypothetical protein SAMN04489835_4558 [Mycolicibacterium rutilum]
MSGFGNYLGATLSSGRDDNSGSVYDESWVTNTNFPERQTLLDGDDLKDLNYETPGEDNGQNKYKPDTSTLGDVPGLTSDHGIRQQVSDAVSGPNSENWESWNFSDLRAEKDALKPAQLQTLADAWTDHGETLKTDSETFKESVRDTINGKWTGTSASAAEAATQQVTKTSIYDFTPSSEALASRLEMLKAAFDSIIERFPDADRDLIDGGDFDKQELNAAIRDFNSKYHLDDGGRLRNNSDGYVSASEAIEEMNRINRSIEDFQLAVQLFRDTYEPTVLAVTENFPTLPPAPNMKYGTPSGDPGGGGGPGTGGGPGGGPGVGGGPKTGTPPVGTPKFKSPDLGKNPAISGLEDQRLTEQGKPPITNPQGIPQGGPPGLAQGLKPAMDAATKAATSGIDAATKAAQQAAQAAGKGLGKNGVPSLREGALGLGDKAGAGKGGGAGAGGAGLGKGGPGVNQPAARLSAQPTTAASGARPAVPVASNAGMGAMGGPGMGGGPAAGQRGGDGKEHKGNKALRTRKNGADIMGETDAVVPVLGDTAPAEESEPAPAQPRRRIPQRGAPWQTDPVSGAARSPRPPQPSPATSD